MLTARELETGRLAVQTWMTDTAVWSRKSELSGDDAGVVATISLMSAAVPCLVLSGDKALSALDSQIADVGSNRILLPYGTDVQTGDRLTVNGANYSVMAVSRRTEGLSVATKCTEISE